jgi:hypothetical protein
MILPEKNEKKETAATILGIKEKLKKHIIRFVIT